ncbi:HTH-type transcriptional activator HxlR [compost metagenome]
MLSTRLKEMEQKGAIERRIVPTSPPSVEYRLTDLGEEFVPAIHAIVEVGYKLKLRREARLAEEAAAQGATNALPA